jgi:cytochrome c553
MKPTFVTSMRMNALFFVAGMALTATPACAEDGASLAARLCATCHGVQGRSESPKFPRLAGQTPEYLQTQLQGFRDGARGESDARSHMWGIAGQLDDAMIQALAAYYGSQAPAPGVAGPLELTSKGQAIFEKGIAESGVPACASCHGAQAQGAGAFPRLAGQHRAYLLRQLEVLKNRSRGNSPVMSAVTHDLSYDEASAVATYLQSR